MKSPIIVALDYEDINQALDLVNTIDPSLCRLKVGKAMFTRFGPQWIKQLQQLGFDIFLDLKYHDIPNTVADAVKAAADLGVWMVNVHASGGFKMMEAAKSALQNFGEDAPLLIAVTVLTSIDQEQLSRLGLPINLAQFALNLAKLSADSGCDGVVCSALEAAMIKQEASSLSCITPGIRLSDSSDDDQSRIMTPAKALAAGSDYLVIGRPITKSPTPKATLQQILSEL